MTQGASGAKPADVFVIFGITGDLAKVMTFHSLYRREQRFDPVDQGALVGIGQAKQHGGDVGCCDRVGEQPRHGGGILDRRRDQVEARGHAF